jgi:glycosyltransferase involved in cell wall biosynthesis
MAVKHLLHALEGAYLASEVRRVGEKLRRRLLKIDQRTATLAPAGTPRGDVLLSYVIDPFLLKPGASVPYSHTHFWETATIAETFVELGYRVDAISWTNADFRPRRDYDYVIDPRLNLERLAPLLPRETVKVLHTDTSHFTFNNPAQKARREALHERRGTLISPVKMLPTNRAAETADLITYLGNEFTRSTYDFANKAMFRIPISVPFTYDWTEGKDFDAVRHRFLWFGSGGLVHKGLDLVLEAFASLPEYHLTVCGPVRREKDFEREYFRELYETPNIHTYGWIDVGGPEFLELARSCLGLVYPSCAEGGGASALTCLHAGLIPVVSRETSIDLDPSYGVLLGGDTVAEIRAAVCELAGRERAALEEMARTARDFARERHTKETFREGYRRFAEQLVDGSWRQQNSENQEAF